MVVVGVVVLFVLVGVGVLFVDCVCGCVEFLV